ncbi:ferric reductase like transmembrane component-domain-containing protein [Echria macrotheca]|uniref:Ferric reductase like transmembrane component-domain-containing protein n=1 Tax=Echria macrotheca TaxID=438768 RepID=A0AAJ0BEF7_9PEZI|nr:ferric reductase like transmembrane component-domain-containing protein [Echria macrotheca]
MTLSVVGLALLLAGTTIPAATASKNGIVGYGIPLYEDLCCEACHDSLASLYLSCTTFDDGHGGGDGDMGGMDMGDMGDMAMGMTSDDCRATNKPWLETMAFCIRDRCDADGYPRDSQAACFSTLAVGGAATPTLDDSLPPKPPADELAADATWLNVTSRVNEDVYSGTHGTYKEFAREEYLHTKYSLILYLVTIGIIVITGILAQTTALVPALRRHIQSSKPYTMLQQTVFLPALFSQRRLDPLPASIGYLPSRVLTLFISVLVILNVVFCSVSFGTFQPGNIWFMSAQFETAEYVGNRSGTLSLVNMSIAILFAGRNNILINLTGWTQTTFLVLHRWTARLAVFEAIVHSIAYTAAYFQPGYGGAEAYAAEAAMPFYWWGIIATIALSLAATVAIFPLRLQLYETFLALHIVLVILALVGCWYHLVPHFGFDYGYQVWLYLCFAFWGADRLARFVRVLIYNPILGSQAELELVCSDGDRDIMQITVFPRTTTGFGPAQHSFLYLAGLGKVWESHPFSVARWTSSHKTHVSTSPEPAAVEAGEKGVAVKHAQIQHNQKPSVTFLVRVHKGMTSGLRRRISESGTAEVKVYAEGPYGGHRAALAPLYAADTVLCIAGGIGITHILGFLQDFAPRGKRVILAWSARERVLIDYVRRNFLGEGLEYSLWYTGGGRTADKTDDGAGSAADAEDVVGTGRMVIRDVLRGAVENGKQTAVLVCAPGGMADEVTKQVVDCVRDGFRVELVEETFAW